MRGFIGVPAVLLIVVSLTAAQPIPSLSSCGNGRKMVALTFDDGPDPIYDDAILAELDQLGVKATFFLSPYARDYDEDTLCQRTRQLAQTGHDVQMHSMRHMSFPKFSWPDAAQELQESIDWMEQCGARRPNMFRPPYGELRRDQAKQISDEFGLIIAMWNVESDDHDTSSQEETFQNIIRMFENDVGVGNSAVILMHNYFSGRYSAEWNSPGLITRIVNYFRERGYSTVTMNQCYDACNEVVCKGSGGPTMYANVFVP